MLKRRNFNFIVHEQLERGTIVITHQKTYRRLYMVTFIQLSNLFLFSETDTPFAAINLAAILVPWTKHLDNFKRRRDSATNAIRER